MFLKPHTVHQNGLGTQPFPDANWEFFDISGVSRARTARANTSTPMIFPMKRKSAIETVSPEAQNFTGADPAKPQLPELVPQTFRLPQRLIEDLVRAGELRALSWMDREGNTWLPSESGAR
jgi:hypothetical protein